MFTSASCITRVHHFLWFLGKRNDFCWFIPIRNSIFSKSCSWYVIILWLHFLKSSRSLTWLKLFKLTLPFPSFTPACPHSHFVLWPMQSSRFVIFPSLLKQMWWVSFANELQTFIVAMKLCCRSANTIKASSSDRSLLLTFHLSSMTSEKPEPSARISYLPQILNEDACACF